MMKKVFLLISAVIGTLILVFFFSKSSFISNFKTNISQKTNLPKIIINRTEIYVEIAKTTQQMAEGLSGRESLAENQGMLFIIENKTRPTFWMKNMLIPIDIVWIADGKVVGIEKNAQPEPDVSDFNLKKYYPPPGTDYVLEVNSGFASENNINVNDPAYLKDVEKIYL